MINIILDGFCRNQILPGKIINIVRIVKERLIFGKDFL